MEITGKVIAVLQPREGTSSQGKQWKVGTYVVETEERYPKKVCFEIFGEDKINQSAPMLQIGNLVKVSFDIDAREWQGRWFNSVHAWKVEMAAGGQPAPAPATPQPTVFPEAAPAENDNLPF